MNMTQQALADRGRAILSDAVGLRSQVREDLRLKRWGNDDIQMEHYNSLARSAAELFPNDFVLTGLIRMPDKQLQMYASPIGELVGLTIDKMPFDLPCRRIEARLSQLIGRLQFVLGELEAPDDRDERGQPLRAAEQEGEVTKIISGIAPEVDRKSFAFVADPRLRVVLEEDYVEAQRALAGGAYKGSAVLVAGVLEGMLLSCLIDAQTRDGDQFASATAKFPQASGKVDWDRVSLTPLIAAAAHLKLIDATTLKMAEGARDFRDTTHPRSEVRQGIRARLEEAELLLALVKLAYRDLAALRAGGA